ALEQCEKASPASSALACGEAWTVDMARRAFRRPLDPAERATLVAAFRDAADGGRHFAAAAELVLTFVLTSPSLLYVTELGEGGAPGDVVALGPYEVASVLSYMLRGGPPDEPLLAAAGAR